MKAPIRLLTLAALPLSLLSADLSGTWKSEFDSQRGHQKYTFTFKQDGAKLTGKAKSEVGDQTREVGDFARMDIVAKSEQAASTAPVPTAKIIRIKAGKSEPVKDAQNNVWLADKGFEGGQTIERPDIQIANTKSPDLYRAEHYRMDSFSWPVPNGKYLVKLHFAETFEGITGPGERVFSFNVQGKEFKGFDVWVKAGGPLKAYVEAVAIEVTKGKIEVTFTPKVENPQICAIEIIPQSGDQTSAVTPAPAAVAPTASSKGLKDVYAGKFLIGCAGDIPGRYSETELANIKANYNVVTPENSMKPQPTHPFEGTYNFATPDALVQYGQQNNIKIWGHTLLWHAQTGRWFFEGTNGQAATRELALERLKKHIMTVVGRYKGRVIGWDVVNESIADGGNGETENLRNSSWYRTVGPDVLTLAFKWAHEADPNAQLYYNDYNIEQGAVQDRGKHASSLLLLKRLIQEGAPINGVGIQGHWSLNTRISEVEKAIENYASLGLKVSISELDVTAAGSNSGAFGTQGGGEVSDEAFQRQAQVYAKLFDIFNRHSQTISRVTFWGISDRRSWRSRQRPLLFDAQLQPKPALQAILDAGLGKSVGTP